MSRVRPIILVRMSRVRPIISARISRVRPIILVRMSRVRPIISARMLRVRHICQKITFEANISQLIDKFTAIYRSRIFITVFTTAYNYNFIYDIPVALSSLLHGVFGQGKKKIKEYWRKRPVVEIHGLSLAKYFYDAQFKEDEIGRTCRRNWDGVKHTPNYDPKYHGKKHS